MADESLSSTSEALKAQTKPCIAIFTWGNTWEDFFAHLGVSVEDFCNKVTGGWLFGYVEALKENGYDVILFFNSSYFDEVKYLYHEPTKCKICFTPTSSFYRSLEKKMVYPYPSLADNSEQIFGKKNGASRFYFYILEKILNYVSHSPIIIASELKRNKCSAIICQEYEYTRFDFLVILGRLFGYPVFASFQGGNYDTNVLGRLVRRFTMSQGKGFIIASQIESDRVNKKYKLDKQKIKKIFNPINLENFTKINPQYARKIFNIPINCRVVVWHGRINIKTKGLDMLLMAWKKVCKYREGKDIALLLLGDGADSEKFHQMLGNFDTQNVFWHRYYTPDRNVVKNFLYSGNIYAFPSRHEGFPVAPVEAMACGLPVVATDAPGVTDIFEHGAMSGGIVVERDDVDAFALNLGRLIDEPRLADELGRRAHLRVQRSFSVPVVGAQLKRFINARVGFYG